MFISMVRIVFVTILLGFFFLNGESRRVKRIVGGIFAAQPPLDDPVVFTKLHSKDARVEGYR